MTKQQLIDIISEANNLASLHFIELYKQNADFILSKEDKYTQYFALGFTTFNAVQLILFFTLYQICEIEE